MADFYGVICGNRGEASRMGSAKSGFNAYAASWAGKIATHLYRENGVDYARVTMEPHHGNGEQALLYEGPVGSLDSEWFVELVDEHGDRYWSGTYGGGFGLDTVLEEARTDAAMSFRPDVPGFRFQFRPIGPVHRAYDY